MKALGEFILCVSLAAGIVAGTIGSLWAGLATFVLWDWAASHAQRWELAGLLGISLLGGAIATFCVWFLARSNPERRRGFAVLPKTDS